VRVNPNISNDLLSALSIAKQQEQTDLLQLASGRRVNSPSDDPAAAAILVQNHAQSSTDDQYLRSATSLQSELQTADSTLSSIVTTLDRATSLGVQGSTGTLSDTDRNALVGELQGIQSQLVSLANLSYQGQYLFAGTATTMQPYKADATVPSGVRYDGNGNTNEIAVGNGYNLQVNLPGSQLFSGSGTDMFQSIQDLISTLQSNSGVDTATAAVRASFDHITAQRVFYGNAMNQLSSQQTYLNNDKLQLSTQEDAVGGADMASTTTSLLNAQNAQTAALAAAGRITQTNLFDYLK
jgi:flagellar hook-associated protein 3 FlgL